jgi:hypothetical protein
VRQRQEGAEAAVCRAECLAIHQCRNRATVRSIQTVSEVGSRVNLEKCSRRHQARPHLRLGIQSTEGEVAGPRENLVEASSEIPMTKSMRNPRRRRRLHRNQLCQRLLLLYHCKSDETHSQGCNLQRKASQDRIPTLYLQQRNSIDTRYRTTRLLSLATLRIRLILYLLHLHKSRKQVTKAVKTRQK